MTPAARDWATVDYYAVLGLDATATGEDVARAYRALAKQLHPDAGGTAEQEERFKVVATAYAVLGDRHRRRDYDRVRRALAAAGPAGPTGQAGVGGDPPPGAFGAARPTRRPFTRRRAWIAAAAGVVTLAAGAAVAVAVWSLHERDADRRAATVAVTAARVEIDGRPHVRFDAGGRTVVAPEPPRAEPGVAGATMTVRYDPDDPERVIADETHVARDVTIAIVALKLLVGGAVFLVVGARRLRRGQAHSSSSATPVWSDTHASPPGPSVAGSWANGPVASP
jgi:hypothetical protein